MTMATKQEIFKEKLGAYLSGSKEEKGRILDAVCRVVACHRKAAIRRFQTLQRRHASFHDTRGRKTEFGPDVTAAFKELWEISGRVCAERLHPVISEYVDVLARDGMWAYSKGTTRLLRGASVATLKRRIATFENIKKRGGRGTTKPSDLKEIIPIRRGPWENPSPGNGEVDTVAHCGASIQGDFCYSVQYTDVSTIWTGLSAQWNKGQEETQKSIERIEKRLPFSLRGLDPDSGSEFINWHLKAWCDSRGIALTRTRPYMKNDHARIEQKNYANVRHVVGYARLGHPRYVSVLNELYLVLEDYLNFFVPSMKCVKKEKIGSKYIRRYEAAQPAYRRVMAHPGIVEEVKEKLRAKYATLNPKILRQECDRILAKLARMRSTLGNSYL